MIPYLIIIHEVNETFLFFSSSNWLTLMSFDVFVDFLFFFLKKEIKSKQKKSNNKNNENDAGEYISWL